MNESLVPDVSHIKTAASFAACLAIGGITVYAALPDAPDAVTTTIVRTERVPVAMPVTVAIPTPSRAATIEPARSLDLHFVMKAGTVSYIKLATVGGDGDLARVALPTHGQARLVETEGASSTAVASVSPKDVEPEYASWLGRKVVVDGACTADVTGLAIVWQLVGDPSYAGIDGGKGWTLDATMQNGDPVLVAKLSGCSGTYARDAALPGVIMPVAIHDESIASEARAALISSATGVAAEQKWQADFSRTDHWADVVPFDVQVVRHPVTGVTWVAVQAHGEDECGNANVNLFGLYRVAPDGKLVPVTEREADLGSIKLLDVDGDGTPELLGNTFFGLGHELQRADATTLEISNTPFYGCGC